MDWQTLIHALFGADHAVRLDGDFLQGSARIAADPTHAAALAAGTDANTNTSAGAGAGAGVQTVTVIGTTHHAPIGVALALAQARAVLDTVALHPGRAIVLLIDTQGQQLRRRDELLGINRAMAHLGCCIDLARRRGHRVIGLVYDQALSGGFITSGLIADACYALPEAEIRVMRIPAMARVTKISEARLTALSLGNPVFAPGVENYVAMGGVRAVWRGDLAAALREALEQAPRTDERAADGAARGGRQLAAAVIQRVLDAA